MTGTDDTDSRITLGILTTVVDASAVTQRRLATELGIALGLANAYVKRCVRKGLVKMRGGPSQPLRLLPDARRVRRKEPPDHTLPRTLVPLLPAIDGRR